MRKTIGLLVCILALSLGLTACGPKEAEVALAPDATLQIVGAGMDVTLTADDLLARERETFECSSISSSGDVSQVAVTGFSLQAILAEHDVAWDDLESLNFVAADGYVMAVPMADVGEDAFVLLNYEGDPLEYPRSCIPDKRSQYWVKNLSKVELVTASGAAEGETASVERIHFFREGVSALEPEELNNRGFKVPAYSLRAYFEKHLGQLPDQPLTMVALDGFRKTETPEVFFDNYVTLVAEEGEEDDLPLYFSETISDGMRVKQLDLVISPTGDAIYFGNDIKVSDLFAAVGMPQAETYRFVASDGYALDVPTDAIEFGKIFADEEKGYLRASFDGWEGASGGGKVKYLLAIEAVDPSK